MEPQLQKIKLLVLNKEDHDKFQKWLPYTSKEEQIQQQEGKKLRRTYIVRKGNDVSTNSENKE